MKFNLNIYKLNNFQMFPKIYFSIHKIPILMLISLFLKIKHKMKKYINILFHLVFQGLNCKGKYIKIRIIILNLKLKRSLVEEWTRLVI